MNPNPIEPAEREQLRQYYIDLAIRNAGDLGKSIKCADGRHSAERFGCANDGSTCICECHDGQEREQ